MIMIVTPIGSSEGSPTTSNSAELFKSLYEGMPSAIGKDMMVAFLSCLLIF